MRVVTVEELEPPQRACFNSLKDCNHPISNEVYVPDKGLIIKREDGIFVICGQSTLFDKDYYIYMNKEAWPDTVSFPLVPGDHPPNPFPNNSYSAYCYFGYGELEYNPVTSWYKSNSINVWYSRSYIIDRIKLESQASDLEDDELLLEFFDRAVLTLIAEPSIENIITHMKAYDYYPFNIHKFPTVIKNVSWLN